MSRRLNKPIPSTYEKFFKEVDNNPVLCSEVLKEDPSEIYFNKSNLTIPIIIALLLLNQKRPD